MDKMLQNVLLIALAIIVLYTAVLDIRAAWVVATVALICYWGYKKMFDKKVVSKKQNTKKVVVRRVAKTKRKK